MDRAIAVAWTHSPIHNDHIVKCLANLFDDPILRRNLTDDYPTAGDILHLRQANTLAAQFF